MPRLAGDRGEAGERSGLLVLEAAEFGPFDCLPAAGAQERHSGDKLVGGKGADAGDAGQDLVAAGKCRIGGDQVGDFGIECLDMPVDLFEPLAALALEEGDSEVLAPVLERRAITHQTVTRVDQLGHLGLLCASGRPDRWLQGGGHAGQQHRVDAIGLGERAGGLGEAPGALGIELDAWSVGQSCLQRAMIGGGRRIGDPLDRPLPGPCDQRLMALGGVGEPALGAGWVGMANRGSLWRCRCR